ARASSPSGSLLRSPTPMRSACATMRSNSSWPMPRRAPRCASASRRRLISLARWRGSWSPAAARAASPPSATASPPPPPRAPRPPTREAPPPAAALAAEREKRTTLAAELAQAARALHRLDPALARELDAALAEELPHLKRDGGFVRDGFNAGLDEARALRD